MMPFARLVLGACLLTVPVVTMAQIYVCKDAGGRTITADRPIPECAKRPMRELDRTGLTRREIPPPVTLQEQQAQEVLDEKRRQAIAATEEQRLFDRALTTRFRREDDIATARAQAVDLLDEQMRIDISALAREMKEMKAAELPLAAGKKSASPAERSRLDDAARAVESRLTSIEQRTAEIGYVHHKYDQSLKRFREIQSGNGSASKAALH